MATGVSGSKQGLFGCNRPPLPLRCLPQLLRRLHLRKVPSIFPIYFPLHKQNFAAKKQ